MITAELHGPEIWLTVEHGNAENCQILRLTRPEMLAAMATAQNALATNGTAFTRYPHGLNKRWTSYFAP